MEIRILYSLDLEIDRIKFTLGKIDWYLSNGYNPNFPKNTISSDKEEKIISALKDEYKSEDYSLIASQIKSDFSNYIKDFEQNLKKIFKEGYPNNIDVVLTKYGVGGSYYPPKKIIYNLNNKKGIKTIFHEIIHLIIEKYIQKYKITHWEKERTVDLVLNSREFGFLKYNYWQKDYHGAENYLDPLFAKMFFNSPEDYFKSIESSRLLISSRQQ